MTYPQIRSHAAADLRESNIRKEELCTKTWKRGEKRQQTRTITLRLKSSLRRTKRRHDRAHRKIARTERTIPPHLIRTPSNEMAKTNRERHYSVDEKGDGRKVLWTFFAKFLKSQRQTRAYLGKNFIGSLNSLSRQNCNWFQKYFSPGWFLRFSKFC